jgi:CubicO group peptidase (beta-lactamase class C family)
LQAAGGLVSTAADLAKWLEAQINQGQLAGRQVVPRHVVAETQPPRTYRTRFDGGAP